MLTFQRIPGIPSAYYASDDTKRYRVYRRTDALCNSTSQWVLEILNLEITAGIKHALSGNIIKNSSFETRALAYAAARAFSDLGDQYQEFEHGFRSRFSEAIRRAYNED